MSRELADSDIPAIAQFLSVERLAALVTLTGSTREAIRLHQQILQLGTSLMTVTAVIEIALRNSICECLSQHFGTAGWLLHPPAPFKWRIVEENLVKRALESARRAAYAKLTQADKHALDSLAYPNGRPLNISHSKRSKDRQSKIVVSDGKIIAELTMFFWKRMFASEYEQALWRTSLKRLFPNKKLRRAEIAEQLEKIYQTRNRLAHHEPVFGRRLDETLAAINFVTDNLGSTKASKDTALAKLLFDEIISVTEQSKALDARLASFRTGP